MWESAFLVAGKSFGPKRAEVSGDAHNPLPAIITDLGGTGPLKVTIGLLPDEVFIEIFELCVNGEEVEEWIRLAHVCRGWRHIVFASPRRLDLRLLFKGKTLVREMLDIWPALPIIIWPSNCETSQMEIADNVIAALELRDRVCDISLDFYFPSSKLDRLMASMQHQFPALTHLELDFWLDDGTAAVIPDLFLGGSAPLLEVLVLTDIVFPTLPNLLLSAKNLVELALFNIPDPGYIYPEIMVTTLSSLTRLKSLNLGFRSPRSRPSWESRRPPPMIRIVLPALTAFSFGGVSEYLEGLVAWIDAPLLEYVHITFFNQLIFDISQLPHFISRIENFEMLDAEVSFWSDSASVQLALKTGKGWQRMFLLDVSCTEADWQLSSIAQVCGLSFPHISTLENLSIGAPNPLDLGQNDIEQDQWLELLHPFITVKNLYLDHGVGLRVSTALQGLVGERATQVLPALQNLAIKGLQESGSTWEALEPFVAARGRFGYPIAVHRWGEGEAE